MLQFYVLFKYFNMTGVFLDVTKKIYIYFAFLSKFFSVCNCSVFRYSSRLSRGPENK